MKIISLFIVAIAFIGVQTFLPVSAASFDCKKAVSEVEKLICQNPELSRLDDEMTRMYKKALASAPDKLPGDRPGGPDWLKRQQKTWLKLERNVCATVGCLMEAYEIRMIELALWVQPEPKTRHHSDVWGAELPTDGTGRAEEARIFEDHLGRIQILYAFSTADQRIYRAYSFFDKAILAEWRAGRGESNEQRSEIDRRIMTYQKEEAVNLLADERIGVIYPMGYFQGKGIPMLTSARKLPRSLFIGIPPCNYQMHSDLRSNLESQTGLEHRFVVIRIYPEPQPMDPELVDSNSSCAEEADDHRLRGRSVNVIAANLHDGTILVKDKGYPLLIRFRSDLESPYLRERDDLFLVSQEDMLRWAEEAQDLYDLDQLVVEKLTGNK